jgi:hypothetical protein
MATGQFERLIEKIDAANQQDPNRDTVAGQQYPRELLYGLRMSEQLDRFEPQASEVLQIAARAQHIRRWEIPRSDYPKNRVGYLTWRRDLGRFHAEQTATLMAQAGYDMSSIARVKDLLMKKGIKQNEETQTLEDVVCLVFLNHYLEDFATKHEEDKLIAIIRKTWGKMSERGHRAALQLDLPPHLSELVSKALAAE